MAISERLEKGLRTVDSDPIHYSRDVNALNTEYLADVLWNSGTLTRITRPSVKQAKKEQISFFGAVEVDGEEVKIPIVVKASGGAAQRYRDDNSQNIKRRGIIVMVARYGMEPQTLVNNFRRNLAQRLKIRLPKRAGVADLSAGRQGWSTQ